MHDQWTGLDHRVPPVVPDIINVPLAIAHHGFWYGSASVITAVATFVWIWFTIPTTSSTWDVQELLQYLPLTSFSFEFDCGPHGCKASFIRSKHSFSVTPALKGGSRQGALRIAGCWKQTPEHGTQHVISTVQGCDNTRLLVSYALDDLWSVPHLPAISFVLHAHTCVHYQSAPSLSFFRHFLC